MLKVEIGKQTNTATKSKGPIASAAETHRIIKLHRTT